jgi:very-short-patch-repair endonuclease
MFKSASPALRARARDLRLNATDHERRLWQALRALNRRGCHFRRQAPFDRYILDFVDHGAKLAIELDGSQHGYDDIRARDAARDEFLSSQGYLTLRFWNNDVSANFDGVVDAIVPEVAARNKNFDAA